MSPALVIIAVGIAAALSARASRDDLQLPVWLTITMFLAATVVVWFAIGWMFSPIAALAITCLLISETDRRHQLIPNLLVLAVLALALVMPFGDESLVRVLGVAALGLAFLLIRQICTALRGVEALGWGDVKLAAAMGAVLGPTFGFVAVALAGAATLIVLTVRMGAGGALATGAPFGIGLATATVAVAIFRAIAP